MKSAQDYDPEQFEKKEELLADFKKRAREIIIERINFNVMNPGQQNVLPPNFAILAIRFYFGLLMPDQYQDFNQNWLNYVADANDNIPTISKYFRDDDAHKEYLKKIVECPESYLSSKKIKTLRVYFNKNKVHFDELIKQHKLWENYVCMLSLAVMTLKTIEHFKNKKSKLVTIVPTTDMLQNLKDEREKRDSGVILRDKYHKKDFARC